MIENFIVKAYRRSFVDHEMFVEQVNLWDTQVDQNGELILPLDKYLPTQDGAPHIRQSGEWQQNFQEDLAEFLTSIDDEEYKPVTSPSTPSIQALFKTKYLTPPVYTTHWYSSDEFEIPASLRQSIHNKTLK